MAYVIYKSNGAKLVSVDDGSVNSSACDITLVGKNYAAYGQLVNQNLVKMLENFSSGTQPVKPITGQVWYDSTNKKIKFYNGTKFKGVPALESSSDQPTDLLKGDLWYDESSKKLYYYNGSSYKLIGPQYSEAEGKTGFFPALTAATTGGPYYVLKEYVQSYLTSDQELISISSNISFTPSSAIDKFPKIKRGITLADADPSTGKTWDGSALTDAVVLWGTAAHALRLGEYAAADYVLKTDPTFSTPVNINSDSGIRINSEELRFNINVDVAQITSSLDRLSLKVSSGSTLYDVINADASSGLSILPNFSGVATNIGSSSKKFNQVWASVVTATNVYGTLTGNVTGTASSSTVANRWAAARTITLGGDLSGSVSIDGSANTTLTATVTSATNAISAGKWTTIRNVAFSGGDVAGNFNIDGSANVTGVILNVQPNSVAIGTDTFGSYVASGSTQGWGISGSVNAESGIFDVVIASTSSNIVRSLVYRDGNGDFSAGVITATATTARYADLAEKYMPDAQYDPGTVLVIGGLAEVTICQSYENELIAGIVSTDPAYTMNNDLEGGVLIALKGRVPCKVKGPVKKGDILVSSSIEGHAETRRHGHRTNPLAVLGKALQDFNGYTGVIEVMVY
jgi:hypothetical protein